ncbi:MAG: hypothetical protein HZC01_01355 [Candidatus Kerfeldbacteria bacterium]|nr:hypothetical protein [Candidatus Kerfeldbacteria bacterium]
MNPAQSIIHYHLSAEGGVQRKLSLFTLSCVSNGYGRRISRLAGMTYGSLGGIGTGNRWTSLLNIQSVIRRIAQQLRRHPAWLNQSRRKAYARYEDFVRAYDHQAPFATDNPFHFLQFLIRRYPDYFAAIGVYNYFWRYLEFADRLMPSMPHSELRRLARERNRIAAVYPRIEVLLQQIARLVARALGTTPRLLLMMTRPELSATLRKRRLVVSPRTLESRRKGYVYFYGVRRETVDGRTQEVSRVKKSCVWPRVIDSARVVRGTSVFRGKRNGTVIRTLRPVRWPRHPIYVSVNTHPNDVPLLKEVSAIVVDEGGGVLSHAAIVSRELRIPSIAGTRIATKVFKDGDRVEVDATSGVVRKI